MTTGLLTPTRRRMLAGSASVGAASLLSVRLAAAGKPSDQDVSPVRTADDNAIRPFRFYTSDAALSDLRRRIAATKWPSRELVTDASQGVQLATMRETRQLLAG